MLQIYNFFLKEKGISAKNTSSQGLWNLKETKFMFQTVDDFQINV